MATNAEPKNSMIDTIKLLVGLLLLIASIVVFYLFPDASLLYRVLGLLAIAGVGAAIALTSTKGKGLLTFMGLARTEVRKVVWPSRQETMQTTLMVFIIVVILSIFLWFVDMFLGWGVKVLLATGS
ncbi:preprotein translocase subunit SecE [Leucothrix pacifica]|uniref:Protein translocase subunit SecE n=1 Tax=Leucothrix pacifica TaxID=1247513 RepID=A0A317CUR4_9GAMM|nr:preprotein translocase subunit SecE [Leucothrix pacifica]PWR00063.1 preprotein translocase subunit SecE [Leucothrix pacifica]